MLDRGASSLTVAGSVCVACGGGTGGGACLVPKKSFVGITLDPWGPWDRGSAFHHTLYRAKVPKVMCRDLESQVPRVTMKCGSTVPRAPGSSVMPTKDFLGTKHAPPPVPPPQATHTLPATVKEEAPRSNSRSAPALVANEPHSVTFLVRARPPSTRRVRGASRNYSDRSVITPILA